MADDTKPETPAPKIVPQTGEATVAAAASPRAPAAGATASAPATGANPAATLKDESLKSSVTALSRQDRSMKVRQAALEALKVMG